MNAKRPSRTKKFLERASEALGELILGLIALAVGYGVFRIFGQENILEKVDPELVMLVGLAVLLLVIGVIAVAINQIRKKKKGNREDAYEDPQQL